MIKVECMNASRWTGPLPDLVFTHPYAPLPLNVLGAPTILNLFERNRVGERQQLAEDWACTSLTVVGRWGAGLHNTVYASRTPPLSVEIGDLVEDVFEPGKGWFPLELPLRILTAVKMWPGARPGMVVWDGFCGRGTVGKACQMLGFDYIGLDKDPARVAIAREYLGLC